MKVSIALSRMRWRLTECIEFSPNQKDIKAYNAVAKAIENRLNQDTLAKKLMVVIYMFLQEKYKLSIYDDADKVIQEEIYNYCERDWKNLVREFGFKNNQLLMERSFAELKKGEKTQQEVWDVFKELSIDLEQNSLFGQLNWMYMELKKKLSWN